MTSELPFVTALLMSGAALCWLPRASRVAGAVTCVTYAVAAAAGYVHPAGIGAVCLVMLLADVSSRSVARGHDTLAHGLFFGLAVLLSIHVVPGFSNPVQIGSIRLTEDAYPFKMYLNLDKGAVGLSLFLLYKPLFRTPGVARSLSWALAGSMAAVAMLLPPALFLDAVAWSPKLPPEFVTWALNNLLLVAFAEEALFRGFLQANLARRLGGYRAGNWIALAVASIAFGLLHYPQGPLMIVFASVAGAVYGVAYRRGGLAASTLAHFGFNAVHFLLFTYPLKVGL